jgi:hypothetical protein
VVEEEVVPQAGLDQLYHLVVQQQALLDQESVLASKVVVVEKDKGLD